MSFILFLLRRALPPALVAGFSAALPALAKTSFTSKTTFSSPKIIEETIQRERRDSVDPSKSECENYEVCSPLYRTINISADGTLASISFSFSQFVYYTYYLPVTVSRILDLASAKESDILSGIDSSSVSGYDIDMYRSYLSDNGKFIAFAFGAEAYGESYLYDLENKNLIEKWSDFNARAISPDGSVVVGYTNRATKYTPAYYKEGKVTPIPKLKGKGTVVGIGDSIFMDIADDNNTIMSNDGKSSAIYHIGKAEYTPIAPLTAGETVLAKAISNDASTVVGYTQDSNRKASAFSYEVKKKEMTSLDEKTASLGSGAWENSYATDVSNDGNIIVGFVDDDKDRSDGDYGHSTAFYYDRKNEEMTDLGAVEGMSAKNTKAEAISGDGRVVIGEGTVTEKSKDVNHFLLWRVSNDEASPPEGAGEASPPEGAPDIAAVDATSTHKTFTQMAEKDHDLHALARGQLDGLATMHCALEDKTYCIGVFGNANRVGHGGHLLSSGIHGALRFAPRWRAGLSLSYLANGNLPGGIKSRGRHTPGVGAYLRYAQNPDRSGLSVTASAAWQKQKLAIRRPTVGQTEPGRGDSTIEGTLLALDGAYGVKLAEGTLLSPTLGLRYLNTRRDGYQETRDASFPATYGKSGEKSTALRVGVGLDHALSARWSLHGDAGTRIVLDRDRDAFTVHGQYLGGGTYDLSRSGEKGRVLPYANVGLSTRWGAHRASLARLDVGIAKSDYGDSDAHIGVRYNYRF